MEKTYGETIDEWRRDTLQRIVDAANPEDLAALLNAAEEVAIQFGPDYPTGIVADLVAAVSRVKFPEPKRD